MADPAHHDYHRGEMDVSMQESTFHLFIGLTKWGSLFLAAFLTLITMWFCTPAGFLAGFITAIVISVIGVVVLREKPDAGH